MGMAQRSFSPSHLSKAGRQQGRHSMGCIHLQTRSAACCAYHDCGVPTQCVLFTPHTQPSSGTTMSTAAAPLNRPRANSPALGMSAAALQPTHIPTQPNTTYANSCCPVFLAHPPMCTNGHVRSVPTAAAFPTFPTSTQYVSSCPTHPPKPWCDTYSPTIAIPAAAYLAHQAVQHEVIFELVVLPGVRPQQDFAHGAEVGLATNQDAAVYTVIAICR